MFETKKASTLIPLENTSRKWKYEELYEKRGVIDENKENKK